MSPIIREIFNQIGGTKFRVMTGAKNFIIIENDWGLQFDLPIRPKGIRRVQIVFTPEDVYDVSFFKSGTQPVEVFKGAYNDMLERLIADRTGLRTRL